MSATTYVGDGIIVDYTPGSAASAGDIVFLGTIAGQVVADVAANEKGGLRIEGVVKALKEDPTDTYAVGATVYWEATSEEVFTSDQSDGTLGKAVLASANGDTHVYVKLNP